MPVYPFPAFAAMPNFLFPKVNISGCLFCHRPGIVLQPEAAIGMRQPLPKARPLTFSSGATPVEHFSWDHKHPGGKNGRQVVMDLKADIER